MAGGAGDGRSREQVLGLESELRAARGQRASSRNGSERALQMTGEVSATGGGRSEAA